MNLSIVSQHEGNQLRIELIGSLYVEEVPVFSETVLFYVRNYPGLTITLVLRQLDYIDSSGIQALIRLHKSIAKSNSHLIIAEVNGAVEKLFRMLHLDKVLTVKELNPPAINS